MPREAHYQKNVPNCHSNMCSGVSRIWIAFRGHIENMPDPILCSSRCSVVQWQTVQLRFIYLRNFYVCLQDKTGLRPKIIGLGLRLGLARCGLGLGLAGPVLCCETRSCYARRHNDLEGHSKFSSTIYSFSILCLEHHYCGDQCLLLT